MPKKIVFLGGYGLLDIGDEAQLSTPLIQLRKLIPEAEFVVLSWNPEHTTKFHKVESDWTMGHYLTGESVTQTEIEPPRMQANRYASRLQAQTSAFLTRFKSIFKFLLGLLKMVNLLANAWILHKGKRLTFVNQEGKRFLNHLKTADLLFNVGGGNIPGRPWVNSLERFVTFLICKILGKPVIVSGQTIGPIESWISKKVAAVFLDKVNIITLRDTTSLRVLQDIGVNRPIIKETADDAILLPAASRDKIDAVLSNENIRRELPLIGINVNRPYPTMRAKFPEQIRLMADAADRLISELGARIVFIPMVYSVKADDRVVGLEMLYLMEHKDRATVIRGGYDDRTLKGIIGQMTICIGFRYHFLVFATTMQIPTIGIYLGEYYKQKVTGILELMGQERYTLDLEKTSSYRIVEVAKEALRNRHSIAKELEGRTKMLGERSLFSIRYAAKLLGGKA